MTVAQPTIDELRRLELFADLPRDHLAWIVEHGECIAVPRGGRLVSRGDPADFMFVVVEGVIQRHEEIGGQWLVVATTEPGQVTGMLPFSRMTHYPGHMVATEPARILRLRQVDFVGMLSVSTELGQRLVARMTDRVRGDVRLEQQREKLTALGRLSAGLAHELNNPAAAASRAAEGLVAEVETLRSAATGLIRHQAADLDAPMRHVEALLQRVVERGPVTESAYERSDREESLGEWLETRAVADAWSVAGALAGAGLTLADLETLADSVPAERLPAMVAWIGSELSVRALVKQVGSATARIAELVASVKLYSHMDRSTEHRPTDVREGLDQTLVVLGHRLRQARAVLTRTYDDVPLVPAQPGELNQVWTNLIENALDAMGEDGQLQLTVRFDRPWVCVEVTDNGPGIAQDMHERIFEPFFTTKAVGDGIGLGLDIAHRIVSTHQGQIQVMSEPGQTTFCVRLPIHPSSPYEMPARES